MGLIIFYMTIRNSSIVGMQLDQVAVVRTNSFDPYIIIGKCQKMGFQAVLATIVVIFMANFRGRPSYINHVKGALKIKNANPVRNSCKQFQGTLRKISN